MGITKLALKFAAPFPKVDSFERYLFVGPHPDDIEIGAGATVAALAAQGKSICFLICTDGRYGTINLKEEISEEELIQIRRDEALRSAATLGVKDVRFLDFCDGGFYEQNELIKKIAGVISSFQPDIIFAPDPAPISECHADHLNVGKAVQSLAINACLPGIMKKLGTEPCPLKALAFYMTAKPNAYMKTTGYFNKQIAALFDNHLSQYPEGCPDRDAIRLYLKLRAKDFGLRSFHITAEGFRMLATIHMHCLPEAGL